MLLQCSVFMCLSVVDMGFMALYSLIDVSSEETSKPTSISKPMSNFRR